MVLGNGLGFWKTMPIRRRSTTGSTVARDQLAVEPDFALDRELAIKSFIRLKQRSSVLLPQPDGPINAVILLRGMSIVMFLSARLDPYQTERSRVESTTGSSSRGRAPAPRAPREVSAGHGRGAFRRRSSMISHCGRGPPPGSSSMITPESTANHDGDAVHQEEVVTRIRIPPATTGWNFGARLAGVIINLNRERGVTVERTSG